MTDFIGYLCFGFILWVGLNQVPIIYVMVSVMGYEWIVALFLSAIFLFFPTLDMLFLFNTGLQNQLVTINNYWSIWFLILFQIIVLTVFWDLMNGKFADFFEVPRGFAAETVVVIQSLAYLTQILIFAVFTISVGIDYGVLL